MGVCFFNMLSGKRCLLTTMALTQVLVILLVFQHASSTEIVLERGGPTPSHFLFYRGDVAGRGFASLFSVQDVPVKLLNVSFYLLTVFASSDTKMRAVIYDSGRNAIASKEFWVKKNDIGWVTVDFSDQNVVINTSPFYVGLLYTGSDGVALAYYPSPRTGNHSFLIEGPRNWTDVDKVGIGGEWVVKVTAVLSHKLVLKTVPAMGFIYVDGEKYRADVGTVLRFLQGTKHNVSVDPIHVLPNGTRLVFERWSDNVTSPSRMLFLDRDLDLVAYFGRQYFVNIVAPHGSSVSSGWFDRGEAITVNVPDIVEISEYSRYRFMGWSGDVKSANNSLTIIVDKPMNITATYAKEHRVSIDAGPGKAVGEGWYMEGGKAVVGVESPEVVVGKTRYVFRGWVGDIESGSPTIELQVSKPLRIRASWERQFFVEIDAGEGKVSLRSGWYPEGSQILVTAETPIYISPGSRLVFAKWGGDLESAGSELSFKLSGPVSIKAFWRKQYLVNASTPIGIVSGVGWYDGGETATVSIDRTVEGFLIRDIFSGWRGDVISSEPSVSFVVDSPRQLVAEWRKDYSHLVILSLVLMASSLTAVAVVARARRKRQGMKAQGHG